MVAFSIFFWGRNCLGYHYGVQSMIKKTLNKYLFICALDKKYLAIFFLISIFIVSSANAVVPIIAVGFFGLEISATAAQLSMALHGAIASGLLWYSATSTSPNQPPPSSTPPAVKVHLPNVQWVDTDDFELPAPSSPDYPVPQPKSSLPISSNQPPTLPAYTVDVMVGCSSPQHVQFHEITDLSIVATAIAAAASAGGCTNPGLPDNTYTVDSVDRSTGSMRFKCQSPVNASCDAIINAQVSTIDNPDYNGSCKLGYSQSSDGKSCVLNDPKKVKKPNDMPCEGGIKSNKFVLDPYNSNCDASKIPSTLSVSSDGKKISDSASKTSVEIVSPGTIVASSETTNSDGSVTNTAATIQSTANGNNVVTGVTSTTTPAGGGTPVKSSTGTNAGSSGSSSNEISEFCSSNPTASMCLPEPDLGSAASIDDLYTKDPNQKNFGDALDSFATKIKSTQLWSSATGFMSFSGLPSGSCGGLSTSVNLMGASIPIDLDSFFCSQSAETIYSVMYIGILIAFTWAAFAIAIL